MKFLCIHRKSVAVQRAKTLTVTLNRLNLKNGGSAVSEHAHKTGHYPLWNEVKVIDRDPHWHTRMVKEAIHIRLHPDNINRDSGIEIPEAWMPTIKKHNTRTVQQRTTVGTTSGRKCDHRNSPIPTHHRDINGSA